MNTLDILAQHVNEHFGISSYTKVGVYRLYRYESVKLRYPKRDWRVSVLNHDRYQYEFRSFQIIFNKPPPGESSTTDYCYYYFMGSKRIAMLTYEEAYLVLRSLYDEGWRTADKHKLEFDE
jgi:hypothetical protein